jgi:anti-anti-sigma factor
MPPAMDVRVHRDGPASVVAVSGAVDAATAPALRARLDELIEAGERRFVVDLSGVPLMDSAGLATLVNLFKRVRVLDGDVRLSGMQPNVRRVFDLVRLDRLFDTFADPDRAVASFGA